MRLILVSALILGSTGAMAGEIGKSRAEKDAEWSAYYNGVMSEPIRRTTAMPPTRKFIYDTRSGEARYFVDETGE